MRARWDSCPSAGGCWLVGVQVRQRPRRHPEAGYPQRVDAIDWSTAQRVGELIAGSPPSGGVLGETVQPLALQFARRVSDYSGLAFPDELPPLEAVDRSRWIAANLQTMRPVLESVAEQGAGLTSRPPPAAHPQTPRRTGSPAAVRRPRALPAGCCWGRRWGRWLACSPSGCSASTTSLCSTPP